MKKITSGLISLFLISTVSTSFGQDFYRTQEGKVLITTIVNDSSFNINAKDLLVHLDYDNSEFTMRLDKSNFHTGIDSIDNKFEHLKFDVITIKGKLAIDQIDTEGHPPLKFQVRATISTTNKTIEGTGGLVHVADEGEFSCILSLKFSLKKEDLGIDFGDLKMEEDIQLDIVQIILDRDKTR